MLSFSSCIFSPRCIASRKTTRSVIHTWVNTISLSHVLISDPCSAGELKTLAAELQDLVQAKVGTTKFAGVYNEIRQHVVGVRRERRNARVVQVGIYMAITGCTFANRSLGHHKSGGCLEKEDTSQCPEEGQQEAEGTNVRVSITSRALGHLTDHHISDGKGKLKRLRQE